MFRRIMALIAVLVLLVGPPSALLAWGFTDWGAIHVWSATDVRVLLGVLTVVAWVAWSVWVLALGVEVAGSLSGRRIRLALPGLSWPQALASALLTTILASGAASVAHATPAAPLHVTAVAEPTPRVIEPQVELARTLTPRAGHTHTVGQGDDLWSLAQRYYGDGARWRTIVSANPALQADPMSRLVPGTVLSVPDPVILVTVKQGDTLSGLARTHLGEADRWPEIHALNAGRITDPDLILPGWVLKVPLALDVAMDAPASAPAPVPAPSPIPTPAPIPTSAPVEVPVEIEDVPAASATEETGATPTAQTLAPDPGAGPAAGLLGGMTALSAAAVIGGLGVRRRIQAQSRPLGRRYVMPNGELSRYEAALVQVARPEDGPARVELLARAMRLLAQDWWQHGVAAPPLVRAVVGPDDLEFVFEVAPASVPAGFTLLGDSIAIGWGALGALPEVDHPVAYPALVTLGQEEPGRHVLVDLMAQGVLGLAGDGAEAGAMLSALLVELACAPWASEVDLVVVTGDPEFVSAAGEGRIVCVPDAEGGVVAVERLVADRSRFLTAGGWDAGRLDPDLAEAWSAQVVLFEVPLDENQQARLEAAVAGAACGVAAVAALSGARFEAGAAPPSVPRAARRALTDLYRLANTTTTHPAPWWDAPREDDVNIIALRPVPALESRTGPRINLLGPVELLGCTGPTPPRAMRQLIEYCAWLLLHPGASPQQMVGSLVVAEGTRRSNMSRLRTWLGADPAGDLYLPDAYSGRIELHPEVGSDWDDLQVLTAGGVNRLPLERLIAALDLVRGAPLADAAPGQWGWAEEFRADAAALIRDVGVVAARVAREQGDLDTSRWAANRALAAAPDDELLLGERILTELASGRTDEVQRLVARVTRTARVWGIDLLPETIDLCQEAVEGRVRARA